MSEAPRYVWRDGELIPFEQATIHVLSHAANRGSEVFDVLRVLPTADGPAAVGLRPHVARFFRSMELMGMTQPYDLATIERAVASTVLADTAAVGTGDGPGAAGVDCTVKLVAAWAEVAGGTVPESLRPSVLVAVVPSTSDGVVGGAPYRLRSATMPKIPAAVLPPALKVAAAYTPGIRQQLAARADGFDDVVFRGPGGDLAELPSQSLLVGVGHRLLAPPLDSVLDGVTRRLVLDLALSRGLPVEIRGIRWDEVEAADELFLSSTTRFIRPVAQLDARTLPAPGPLAAQLAADVTDLVAGRHRLSSRWLTPLRPLAG